MWDEETTYFPSRQNDQQVTSFQYGVLKDLKDPNGLGRGRFEVSSIFDEGEGNWTNWADIPGCQLSGTDQAHACGIWWPGQPGDLHLLTTKDGDWLTPIAFPGLAWAETPDNG